MTNSIYDYALFCNGQGSETLPHLAQSGCANVNKYDLESNIAFPNNCFQTFYYMGFNFENKDSCSHLTDQAESLLFCDSHENICRSLNNKGLDYIYMCEGYCYLPGSDATNSNNSDQVSLFEPFWNETPERNGS